MLRFLGVDKGFRSHHPWGEMIMTVVEQLLACFSCFLSFILPPRRLLRNECLYSTEHVPLTRAVGPPRVLRWAHCELLARLPSEAS